MDQARSPHGLGGEQVPQTLMEMADQLLQGFKYVFDASLDAAPLLSKLSPSRQMAGQGK